MEIFQVYFFGLIWVLVFFTLIWIVSVILKNASIVDFFWSLAFVMLAAFYFYKLGNFDVRKILVLILTYIWGIRLSLYIFIRNYGKNEDFRYQEFRRHYGGKRYWWVSFFQVFLLQGVLAWLISAPLLAIMYYSVSKPLHIVDAIALLFWIIGFIFEAGGDFQMARFKRNKQNKGAVLQKGLWKYTRHPNYFGDAMIWWGFALFSISVGSFLPVLSAILMSTLLLKVSGVSLLEKTLKTSKPEYADYIKRTSAFFPWIPKKAAK